MQTIRGTIARVEPFAAALPREFQRSFIPVERQQVIRVEFAPGAEIPPLFTKVQLRSADIAPTWVTALWHKAVAMVSATPGAGDARAQTSDFPSSKAGVSDLRS
jgi:hypothetical protein